jgi:excisionase family DNA binding protein
MSTILLSVSQAAERANVSYGTMYRMIKDGRISCIRFGKIIRIKQEELGISIPDEKPSMPQPELKKEAEPPKGQSLFSRLRPQIEKIFEDIPSFGEVGFRIILHDSQVVRFECSSSVMVKMETVTPQINQRASYRK